MREARKHDMAGLTIKLKISTVMPDNRGVHVDDALRDQVAHQYSLIEIARRQIFPLHA